MAKRKTDRKNVRSPTSRTDVDYGQSRPYIRLDPEVSNGQAITGRGSVRTAMISERYLGGESLGSMAREYGITLDDIILALSFEARYGTEAKRLRDRGVSPL